MILGCVRAGLTPGSVPVLMQVILTLKFFPFPWETAKKVDKCISWPERFVNSSEAVSYVLNI